MVSTESIKRVLEDLIQAYLEEADAWSVGGFRRNLEEDAAIVEARKVLDEMKKELGHEKH